MKHPLRATKPGDLLLKSGYLLIAVDGDPITKHAVVAEHDAKIACVKMIYSEQPKSEIISSASRN